MVVPRGQMVGATKRGDLAEIKRLVEIHGLYSTPKSSKGCLLLAEALRNDQRDIAKFLLDSGAQVTSHSNKVLYRNLPLHLACSRGYQDIAELCIQRGADVNQMDHKQQTPLDHTSDAATARSLLQNGAHYMDKFGHNQLYAKLKSMIWHSSDCDAALDWLKLIDDHGGLMSIVSQPRECYDLLTSASSSRIFHELLRRGLSAEGLIHHCARRGELDKVKSLIEFGAVVKARDSKGSTALHAAAEGVSGVSTRRLYKVVKFLLQCDKRLDVNLKDIYSCTALHHAIQGGNVNIVELLLTRGADPNIPGPKGITPLAMASKRGGDLTKILLEHGADPLALVPNGDTALNKIRDIDSRSLDVIIDHGLHKKLLDGNGNSPLHIVCKNHGSDQCLKELLDNGIDPNLQNNKGETSLHIATRLRKLNTVKILLRRGADASARTTDGLTALHIAADYRYTEGDDYESEIELIRLLVRKSPNVNAADASGKTPLHYAIFDREIFELLLNNGANINAEDHKGKTPLYIAIESDDTDAIDLFLDPGIDLLAPFRDGTTPIHLAARGMGNVLRLFFDHTGLSGMDVDCLDANGETLLFNALMYSDLDETSADEFLLDIGANLDLVYWIDKKRMRDWFSKYAPSCEFYKSEQICQLSIKLSVARLLPSSITQEFRESYVLKYKKELERLKKCMITRSMSLYDYLHDENRQTAKTICQVRDSLDDMMADFPNYRGLIESKIKIDLAYGETPRVATKRIGPYPSRSPSLQRRLRWTYGERDNVAL